MMSRQGLKGARALQTIKAHGSDVTCVEFYGSSLLFTGSSDKTVRAWRWNIGQGFVEESFSPLLGHKYGVTSVRVSPQGSVLASASVDGTIILWDIANGNQSNLLSQENDESIRSCAFSPDGSLIASSDDSGTVCLWGHDKTIIRIIRCHEEAVHTVAFSPDSSVLLTACTLGNIRIHYNDVDNDSLSTLTEASCSIDAAHDMGVLSADFCKFVNSDPSDNLTNIYTVATCGTDHFIKVWRIFSRKDLSDISENRSKLIPISPQEHMCGNATIYCTETMNAECVFVISAHGSSVTCVRFNPAGTFLLSCGLDKTIKVWDLQGNCLKTLREHSRYVNSLSVNCDSTIFASGSNDRTVIVWDLTGKLTIDSRLTDVTSALYQLAAEQQPNSSIPSEFICPITHDIMRNPVIAEDGFSYEHLAIQEWFDHGKTTSPMTNEELTNTDVIPNTTLKEQIDEFLKSMDFDAFNVTPDLLN